MDSEELPTHVNVRNGETQEHESYIPRLVGLSNALHASITPSSSTSGIISDQVSEDGVESSCRCCSTTDYFTSLQWSPDGTTILLPTASNRLETYVLPLDLLDPPVSQDYHRLKPYNTHVLPEPTQATVIYPYYALSSPETCLYLTSPRNLPIRLLSPFAEGILASYPFVNTTTEAWLAPHSLLFSPRDANTFFAGHDAVIAIFDLQRNGECPVSTVFTRRGKKKRTTTAAMLAATNDADGPRNLRGIISAMAMNTEGILAAGTFAGNLGLLDTSSPSAPIIECRLPPEARSGITSLHFHPSPSHGNYLLAASRLSTSMHLFDIRNPTSPFSELIGRRAMTQQRLRVDITENGEVLAGGTDGVVKVWERIGMREGELQATWGWQAHEDVVGGVGAHPSGAGVVATCSGSRRYGLPGPSRMNSRPEESEEFEGREDSDTDSVLSSSSDLISANSSSSSVGFAASSVHSATYLDCSMKVWAL